MPGLIYHRLQARRQVCIFASKRRGDMLARRDILIGLGGAALAATAAGSRAKTVAASVFGGETFRKAVAAAERSAGGRLGVAVMDTGSGARFAWRGDERFAFCSTFKFLLAAAVLDRVDRGQERLDRRIPVTASDLRPNSPVSGQFVGTEGMTVAALCEAAMTRSDNAAANLLLGGLGGPAGLTRYLRDLGDAEFRLDHYETALNDVGPGEVHDTTTPRAMLGDMDRILLGSALSPASRERITGWLVANRTGDRRLRAGVPRDWRVGDKTGTWDAGTSNDLAIFWPPGRKPILAAALLMSPGATPQRRESALAEVGRAIAGAVRA
jgi:beta-lactamase class A